MTLGLALITNDAKEAKRLMADYDQQFDKFFITATNKKTYAILNKDKPVKLELSYFEWVDDFGAARNANLATINTDYFMWLDSDDRITKPEELGNLVKYMEAQKLDVVYLKYNYFQNQAGEGVNDHWRERIVHTASGLVWADVPVHETLIAPYARSERIDSVEVFHNKDPEGSKASHERNVKLLTKHWEKTKDPRTAFYLGMEKMVTQDYEEAIEMFRFLIAEGGWDEEKYDAWLKISDCYIMLTNYGAAQVAANMAEGLDPVKPDAYWQKVFIYGMVEKFDKAIEWAKVAMAKPVPDTIRMIDPTLYSYRGLFMAAQCYLFSGKPKEAYQLFGKVRQLAPMFVKEQSDEVDWAGLFETSFVDAKAIEYIQWLLAYTKGEGGKPAKVLEALPYRLLQDVRLNAERAKLTAPLDWPEKSIAFYCGPAYEAWGPELMDKGLGGSEEAVVYLSRELVKLGWQVTVYNDREAEHKDWVKHGEQFVLYKPWTMLNPNDKFDVFVAWRMPQMALGVKARLLVTDLHDMPDGAASINPNQIKEIDKFFFKSKYQKQLTEVPDDKAVVVGNGIVADQFTGDKTKKPFSVGYYSSYDRGLDCLLDMWPAIREAVPEATLDIYYGWDMFDKVHSKNPERMKWKWSVLRKLSALKDQGVVERGRVSHQELADAMNAIQVWAYPTEFTEIHCITALKTAEAEQAQVHTGVAALVETAPNANTIAVDDIYTNKAAQTRFVSAVAGALLHPKPAKPIANRYWSDVAKVWSESLEA